MKKSTLTVAVSSVLIGSTGYAAPFMAVGSSAELFVTARATIEANDNVTLGNDYIAPGQTSPLNSERKDTVFRLAPGLSFEFGQNALLSGKLAFTETFVRYSDNSDLDDELADLSFNAQHSDGKSKTTAKASYRELNQNTVDLRLPTLSRRDVFNAGIEHETELTAKTSLLFGFDRTDTDYESASFIDRVDTKLPVRAYYELTPKVDMSFTLQYREMDADSVVASSEDWFYAVGARGEFTPKLTGFLRVGVTDRNNKVGGDRTSLGLESDFTYAYSTKTNLTFGVSNMFDTTGSGASQENLDIFVGFRSKLTPDFTLASRVSVREIDYFARPSDTYWAGSVRGEYIVNEYLQLHGAFNYSDNKSGSVGGDFDNSIFSLSALLRY